MREGGAAKRIPRGPDGGGRYEIGITRGRTGAHRGSTDTQPNPNSTLPPGSTRVSGRASALLGVAGLSLATHRPLLCGDPTYYTALTGQVLRTTRRHCLAARCC